MKRPTKKKIEEFIKAEFPHVEFDGIKIEESSPDRLWFKVISYGRMIGQADYYLNDRYWSNVKNHLTWTFGKP